MSSYSSFGSGFGGGRSGGHSGGGHGGGHGHKDRDKDRGGDRDGRDAMSNLLTRKSTKKRPCRFCADPKFPLDYKEPRILVPFMTDRGKIIPRRVTGNCALHQRRLQTAVKRARVLALISFTSSHLP